jgi:hypothetical protein
MHAQTSTRAWRFVGALAVAAAAAGSLFAGRGAPTADDPPGKRRVTFTVSETEGIRRFGYPVSADVSLPRPAARDDGFRLSQDGKLVPAQFEPGAPGEKGARAVRVAFEASLAPYETRTYAVEYGPALENTPDPGRSLRVERGDGVVRVSSREGMNFTAPDDLLGLLRQAHVGGLDFLRPGSPGLLIRSTDRGDFRAGGPGPGGKPTAAIVIRQGPVIAALRFEGAQDLGGGRAVTSAAELEFARSKSWVRVAWSVDDPRGHVRGLDAVLHLNVAGGPTLVDFGAGSLVYAALGKGQEAALRGGPAGGADDAPAWESLLGPAGALRPYVVAPRRKGTPSPEGWAHVMDRERCTAVAVDGFADAGQQSELSVAADGRLRVQRTFGMPDKAPPRGPKRLSFTLHFVSMPVHVGAATSPQAMLHPLRVEVGRPAGAAP